MTAEYGTRKILQQNSLIEKAFTVIYTRLRPSFDAANILIEISYLIFSKQIRTIVLCDSLHIIQFISISKSSHEWMRRVKPKQVDKIQVLDEAGTIFLIQNKTLKIEEKGVTCTFIDHAEKYVSNYYHVQHKNQKNTV